MSCDYGTQNAFAALLWAFDGKVWHVVDEYRYSGRDTGTRRRTPTTWPTWPISCAG
ncbi:MAG: hypothetical protein ACLS89_03230 [Collinsella sp.]